MPYYSVCLYLQIITSRKIYKEVLQRYLNKENPSYDPTIRIFSIILETIIVTTHSDMSPGKGNSSNSRNCFIQFCCMMNHLLNPLHKLIQLLVWQTIWVVIMHTLFMLHQFIVKKKWSL